MKLPFLCSLCIVIASALGSISYAHDYNVGALTVDNPWGRPNLPERPTAAYLEIRIAGETPDRLIIARAPGFDSGELHTTTEEGGVMKMAQLDAIVAPAGGSVDLEPGGHHIMLFGAPELYKEGDKYNLILVFENAGELEVEVHVERGSGGAHNH